MPKHIEHHHWRLCFGRPSTTDGLGECLLKKIPLCLMITSSKRRQWLLLHAYTLVAALCASSTPTALLSIRLASINKHLEKLTEKNFFLSMLRYYDGFGTDKLITCSLNPIWIIALPRVTTSRDTVRQMRDRISAAIVTRHSPTMQLHLPLWPSRILATAYRRDYDYYLRW